MNNNHNKKHYSALIAGTLLFLSTATFANPYDSIVTGLQMPAWVTKGDQKIALRIGMKITSEDQIETASKARLLMQLGEGSLVKLGENAQLKFNKIAPPKVKNGVFNAAIKVIKGAFRFTTQAIGAQKRRNIDVRVGTVTAGIRGTDIWGKSDPSQDLVCLLEGKIQVNKDGYSPVEMSEPLSFYVAPFGKDPLPVAEVLPEKLATWVPQTELTKEKGILIKDGKWSVNLASYRDIAGAKEMLNKLDQAGYGAEVNSVQVNNLTWYRITIKKFKSRKDALYFANSMNGQFNIRGAWIEKS